jgi:hypothetical protein
LVVQAQAHKTWWGDANHPGSAAGKYLQWVTNRNAALFASQNVVMVKYAVASSQIRVAKRDNAIAVADALKQQTIKAATAQYDYLLKADTGMIGAAKQYNENLAQAQRVHAIALAQAAANRAVRENNGESSGSAFEQERLQIEQANQQYQQAVDTVQRGYASAAATATSIRMAALADAHLVFAQAVSASATGRRKADNGATYQLQLDTSIANAALTANYARLDKSYWVDKTAGLRQAASALASTIATASPWASYHEANMGAYHDWMQAASDSHASLEAGLTQAQSGLDAQGHLTGSGQTAIAAAKRAVLDSAADEDKALALQLASDIHSFETSKAAEFAAGSGFGAAFPQLADTAGAAAAARDTTFIPTPANILWLNSVGFVSASTSAFDSLQQAAALVRKVLKIKNLLIGRLLVARADSELVPPTPADKTTRETARKAVSVQRDVQLLATIGPNQAVAESLDAADAPSSVQLDGAPNNLDRTVDQTRAEDVQLPPRPETKPPQPPGAAAPASNDRPDGAQNRLPVVEQVSGDPEANATVAAPASQDELDEDAHSGSSETVVATDFQRIPVSRIAALIKDGLAQSVAGGKYVTIADIVGDELKVLFLERYRRVTNAGLGASEFYRVLKVDTFDSTARLGGWNVNVEEALEALRRPEVTARYLSA